MILIRIIGIVFVIGVCVEVGIWIALSLTFILVIVDYLICERINSW